MIFIVRRLLIPIQEIYCNNHVPNANPHDVPVARIHHSNGAHLNGNGHAYNGNGVHNEKSQESKQQRQIDAGLQDLKIAQAIKATQVLKPYPKIKHEGAKYVVDYDAQTRLELLHRGDEDQLYQQFSEDRHREMRQFESEVKEEWEKALADFSRRFEAGHVSENQKDELIRHLTIKRDKKLETITSKRKERERLKTAELVDHQAREMLELFRQARHERVGDNDVTIRCFLLGVVTGLFSVENRLRRPTRRDQQLQRHQCSFFLSSNPTPAHAPLVLQAPYLHRHRCV